MIKSEPISHRLGLVVLLGILVWLSTSQNAHAYIDPGAGSYVFQILVASLLAGLFFLKTYWQRVKAFFTKESSEDSKSAQGAAADGPDEASASQTADTQGSSNESDRNDK